MYNLTDFAVGMEVFITNGYAEHYSKTVYTVKKIIQSDNYFIPEPIELNNGMRFSPDMLKPALKEYSIKPHIYFDLDGTLSKHMGHKGYEVIGEPVMPMISKLKDFLERGYGVKIFTARANIPESIPFVKEWIKEHIGKDLEVTNIKGIDCVAIYDDRAYRVKANTGEIC